MESKRDTIIRWLSLLTAAFIGLQIVLILTSGDSFCFNQGCRIVDQLTTIPPLYINLAGLLYFITLFGVTRRRKAASGPGLDLPRLLLLLGLMAEGVLITYQLFVIRVFCSYCLGVFTVIVVLNLLCGWRQIGIGLPLFGAIIASFATLNFSPASLLTLRSETLISGTYAIKKCAAPVRKLYFIFSADCPHCKNVLSYLENCDSCEFHFNPIDTIQSLAIPDLEYPPSYQPSLNRAVLSMLGISAIPVLVAENQDGFTFIKGEESIIRFISQTCSPPVEEKVPSEDQYQFEGQSGMSGFDENEGSCYIEEACPDEPEPTQSPINR